MMRSRFPLLLLLGVVFLASVSLSFGIAYWEKENLSHNKCLRSCSSEKNTYRHQACHARCNLLNEDKEHQEREHSLPRPRPQEEEEKEDESRQQRPFPIPFPIPIPRRPREHEQHHESEGSESSRKQKNPFYFSSNRFFTFFKNSHGHIRLLQRFDQQSKQLQNLQDYRLLETQLKPHTLLLPHHVDADYIIIILSGRAILTLENPDERDSYNLQSGDVQKIPAGTTLYLINPDNEETLKVMALARPVNSPGRIENFFLSSTEFQQSYLQGFSKNILEATFDTQFKEINRVLFGEEEGQQQDDEESQQKGVIVKLSKEQIRELSKHAKSSSKKTISSKDKPFNLRSGSPIYSNTLGRFYEITPEKNPQLRDMDVFVSFVDMKEGGLLLPHYNSKAIVILVVNKGEANIELVGLTEQQQQKQQEVQKYRTELSKNDVFVIPAAYPVAINATSNLNFFAFGINAENNQRNFLAGEKDNVISEIPRQVFEVAFPGSGEDVEKLIKKKRESYFVAAQPQQKERGRHGRNVPLSSILGALH
ncbi:RmlC-like jelly roll fold [Vigna unguiculata]|uniref:RmlC-like jelly roll fold n=1 Tax=Vigna unguiculata TaxID=3917 RepID=A0A4D6N4W3_VIGUN|nr:RmlC-like jelly roll fold [Vigna unguiculata]